MGAQICEEGMWNELAGKFCLLEAKGEEDLPAEALSQIFQVLPSFLLYAVLL